MQVQPYVVAPRYQGFSLAVTVADEAEAKRRFEALADDRHGELAMARQIFVNLPVRDLERSKAFFARLGLTFITKAVCDATKSTEVLVSLSRDSKEELTALVAKAAAGGGKAAREPKDHGFMYEHAFEDPDGHIWELVHMRGQP